MKTLISAQTVQEAIAAGRGEIAIDPNTIITPQARDMADAQGIRFVEGHAPTAESAGSELTAERIYQCLSALLAKGALNESILAKLAALGGVSGLHIERTAEQKLAPDHAPRPQHQGALETMKCEAFALDGQTRELTASVETLYTVLNGQVELRTGGEACRLAAGDTFAAAPGLHLSMRAFGRATLTATQRL